MKKKSKEEILEQGKKVQAIGASVMLMGCATMILIPIIAVIIFVLI
jgi:hypothetical protein